MLKVFYFKVTTSNNKRHRYPTLLCYDNTHSDPHVTLAQTMNGSNRGKPMKEEVMKMMVGMWKRRLKLHTCSCLKMKILLMKQFPEKIYF